jgi:hypothetical protein
MILCVCARCAKCRCSVCCRNISAMRLEDGTPIASPSFWIMVSLLFVKSFCVVMTSYHWRVHVVFGESVLFCFSMFVMIVLVSFTGMFGYQFFMSSDAKV